MDAGEGHSVNESQVFANALKLATPAERAAYLDGACAGNPQLRADVEALLRAQASDPDFLDQPPGSLGETADAPAAGSAIRTREPNAADQPGVVLAGRYKLLERIGEGGWARSGWRSRPSRCGDWSRSS